MARIRTACQGGGPIASAERRHVGQAQTGRVLGRQSDVVLLRRPTVNAIVDSAVFVAETTALVRGARARFGLRSSDVLAGRAVLAGFAVDGVMAVDGVLARCAGRAGFTGGALGGGRSAPALRSAWSRGSQCRACPACAVARTSCGDRRARRERHERDTCREDDRPVQLTLRILRPPGRSSITRGSDCR